MNIKRAIRTNKNPIKRRRDCGNNKNKSWKLTHYNTLQILNSKWKLRVFQNPAFLKIQKFTPTNCKTSLSWMNLTILIFMFNLCLKGDSRFLFSKTSLKGKLKTLTPFIRNKNHPSWTIRSSLTTGKPRVWKNSPKNSSSTLKEKATISFNWTRLLASLVFKGEESTTSSTFSKV